MAKSIDWLPHSRQDQLNMANNWIAVLKSPSGTGSATMAMKWEVPAVVIDDLQDLANKAENAKGGKEGEGAFGPMLKAVIP